MQATRKRVILAALEATYGTDAVPTAAILCSNLTLNPLDGSAVERDFIRPYFGASGQIRVENLASVSFDTEIAGSGTAGTVPPWGILLKACNFSETITAAAITGTAQAGGTTTSIVLAAAASAVDSFYNGMSISLTAGTGNGQSGVIVGYVGATKVATISTAWTLAPDATSGYSIGANVIYAPNSNFGTAVASTSGTFYFNVDGTRHVLLGARGTVSLDITAKAIPKLKWKFTGLLGTISDVALPAATFTAWQIPATVSSANTTQLNLFGYTSAVLQSLSIDIANKVVHRQLVGTESVLITDRMPVGKFVVEATTVAAKDWWTLAKAANTSVFSIQHGQTAGNIVGLTAPKAQLTSPSYSDSDGVNMLNGGLEFVPFSSNGNDELLICVK